MRSIFYLVLLIFWRTMAFAYQDPDDPGMQDSLIVGTVYVDSVGPNTYVCVPVDIVTDDSVWIYMIPLSWESSIGGVTAEPDVIYHWCSGGDTIYASQRYILLMGFGDIDSCEVINTHGVRMRFLELEFRIDPTAPSQTVVLDTTYDQVNTSLFYGLIDGLTEFVPCFIPGQIVITNAQANIPESSVPQAFSLYQSYPNPFNAQTTISYSLAQAGPATLSIYNIMGQKVATLFDGVQQAGEHMVVWDAGDVSSGVYFGRLVSGLYNQNIKLILLR